MNDIGPNVFRLVNSFIGLGFTLPKNCGQHRNVILGPAPRVGMAIAKRQDHMDPGSAFNLVNGVTYPLSRF